MLGFWLMLFTVKLYSCKDIFKNSKPFTSELYLDISLFLILFAFLSLLIVYNKFKKSFLYIYIYIYIYIYNCNLLTLLNSICKIELNVILSRINRTTMNLLLRVSHFFHELCFFCFLPKDHERNVKL